MGSLAVTISVLTMAFLCFGCISVIGPHFPSAFETERLVREKAGIVRIERMELCTAGPIYRLVIGLDEEGQEKGAWIDTDVQFVVTLAEGISRPRAIEVAESRGFSEQLQIQLIYKPAQWQSLEELAKSGSQVFWWIIEPAGAAPTHDLWLNFYDGRILWEGRRSNETEEMKPISSTQP